MGEREARARQGKRGVRRQSVGGATGRLHAWGKTWRGPEVSGVGKSEATIHHSLRSLSQLLVSPCIKPGHTAGVCAVTGDLITFGSQWITLEGAFHASTLSCHRTLGKLRQQVCGSRLIS